LQDETSFTYDPERLADPRQPLHPDLANALAVYLAAHPEIADGDLVTMAEPGLSGYTVCIKEDCVQTDVQGNFSIPNPTGASSANLQITDPHAEDPALAMRYINHWKGPVTVPAYTREVDTATMAKLTLIPLCDADLEVLVCKLDGDTLQVRDQYLNNTAIIPIGDGKSVISSETNEIGLMQGFLTLPFVKKQEPDPFIVTYFDIVGYRIFDEKNTYTSTLDEIMLSYDGNYFTEGVQHLRMVSAGDSHTGLDYLVPFGNLLISGAPISKVWYLAGPEPEELRINIMFQIPEKSLIDYDNCYGHVAVQLVEMYQIIYRGQIVGLSGNSGEYYPSPRPPMLHFHVGKSEVGGGWFYLDEYRYIVNLNPLPENFWGNPVSLWSSDNLPQFSR